MLKNINACIIGFVSLNFSLFKCTTEKSNDEPNTKKSHEKEVNTTNYNIPTSERTVLDTFLSPKECKKNEKRLVQDGYLLTDSEFSILYNNYYKYYENLPTYKNSTENRYSKKSSIDGAPEVTGADKFIDPSHRAIRIVPGLSIFSEADACKYKRFARGYIDKYSTLWEIDDANNKFQYKNTEFKDKHGDLLKDPDVEFQNILYSTSNDFCILDYMIFDQNSKNKPYDVQDFANVITNMVCEALENILLNFIKDRNAKLRVEINRGLFHCFQDLSKKTVVPFTINNSSDLNFLRLRLAYILGVEKFEARNPFQNNISFVYDSILVKQP